ncbi:MAG: hypothetical protein J6T96_16655 [Bacteroidales bacterium]|nr:hypothetical protein [Bacteroidales bacterium]
MKTLLVFIVLLFSAICVNAQFSQTVGNITYYYGADGTVTTAIKTGNITTYSDNKGNSSTAIQSGNTTFFSDNKGNTTTVNHYGVKNNEDAEANNQ